MSMEIWKCVECGKLNYDYENTNTCMYCGSKQTEKDVVFQESQTDRPENFFLPHSSGNYFINLVKLSYIMGVDLPNEPLFLKAVEYANDTEKQLYEDLLNEWANRRNAFIAKLDTDRLKERQEMLEKFNPNVHQNDINEKITALRAKRKEIMDLKMRAAAAKLDAEAYVEMIKSAAKHFNERIEPLSSVISAKTELTDEEKNEYESSLNLMSFCIGQCAARLQNEQLVHDSVEYKRYADLIKMLETETENYDTLASDLTRLSNEAAVFYETLKEFDAQTESLCDSAQFGKIDHGKNILYK